MKKGYLKLLFIGIGMIIILIINSFTQIFSFYAYTFFLLLSFIIIKSLIGFEKDNFTNKKEIIIILIGSIMLYYTVTFSTVFFWGILKSRFILSWSTFFSHIAPLFLIIIFSELIRYLIIRKGRRYKSIFVIAVILLTLMEISLKTKGYDFSQNIQIIKFSLEIIAVSLSKNIFLCYLTNKVGYKPAIIYRCLLDLPLYILPFFPNLGIFIDSIIKIIFPNILLFILIFNYSNLAALESRTTNKKMKIIGTALIVIFVLIIVALSSTKFKYFTIVVGSGSMSPNIEKGDIVFVNKTNNISTIKENDILIFTSGKTTIIHRIIRIEDNESERFFYTKGDANEKEDYQPVRKEDIIGIAMFKMKYLGYPTVWLNEKIR